MKAKVLDGHAAGVGSSTEKQPNDTVRVMVIYPAASKPFKAEVDRSTTLGQVKVSALEAFGLEETATKTFKLFHGVKEFADLSETVGDVAGKHQELVFQLEEVIVQG